MLGHSFFELCWLPQLLCCTVLSCSQSCLTLCDPMGCSPSGSSVHGDSQARTPERVAMPSNPGIEPRSPTLQVDSLLSESPEKHKNAGVGSLSFFQGIFPSQESDPGLLHCRQILNQLSFQGSPNFSYLVLIFLFSCLGWCRLYFVGSKNTSFRGRQPRFKWPFFLLPVIYLVRQAVVPSALQGLSREPI